MPDWLDFVNRHPTIKMLALSFLMLVGVVLVAEGCGQHIEKGYIYFAMAFSFAVEVLNIRARQARRLEARRAPLGILSSHVGVERGRF